MMIFGIATAVIFVFCCLFSGLTNSGKNKGRHPRSRASNTCNGNASEAVTCVGKTDCGGGVGGNCGGGGDGGDGSGSC